MSSVAPLFTMIGAAVIFIATCNQDPAAVLAHPFLFHINPTPTFSNFFIISDIDPTNRFYLFQKVGHMLGFGLLFVCLFNWIKKVKPALMICGGYGFLTEILQLFFYRDGRIFDVLIDVTGIFLALLLCRPFYKRRAAKVQNF